jgi:glutaminyl-tRNA synthetase
MTTLVRPSLVNALPDQNFQPERQSYFVTDRMDHVTALRHSVWNLT